MSIALLYPGQGAQTPGFLHALGTHAAVLETLQEVSQYLGHDVLELDTAEALRSTVAVQLALLTAGVAFARFLQAEGIVIEAAAGMSVGAFAAAVAAGSLSFDSALRFVQRRAEIMTAVFPIPSGMAVIEGLREQSVRDLIRSTTVTIANFNSPLQFVVAGLREELAAIVELAAQAGAHRAMLLDTATASHTDALADGARTLLAFAETLPMQDASIPVYSNRTARPLTQAAKIREDLAWNMAQPVRWHDVQTALYGRGSTLLLEAPPGHTLTRLATDTFPDLRAFAAGETRWDILLREARRGG